ncbi:hypothetical protein V8G54_027537 [Vigna mungo]|uniref:O-methyltransferase C-terminal domain-containing protein n=1 Tax=Vigna mungo TaxID=3915 RepID=A0AAQ3N2N3_VIGMU
MLSLLATHSLLTCSTRTNENGEAQRFYHLSHVGHYFVKDQSKGSLAPLSTFLSYPSIAHEAFLDFEKGLYEKVHGMPIYEGICSDSTLRIEQVEGNMFESVPQGDAIISKAVLHNWSDEKCVEILKNCYKALPEKGKVIVMEIIMPEAIHSTDADKMVTGFDNLMFLDAGTERTEKQFHNLSKLSGFSHFQLVCRVF